MYSRDNIQLRECRGEDASLLLEWENNQGNWQVSNRSEALTMKDLESLINIQQNTKSIFDLDQYRYMICDSSTGRPIGAIDFYDADWKNDSAYIGILIANAEDRRKGIGFTALEQLLDKMRDELELFRAHARIQRHNTASIRLFEKVGFRKNLEENNQGEREANYIEFVYELEKK